MSELETLPDGAAQDAPAAAGGSGDTAVQPGGVTAGSGDGAGESGGDAAAVPGDVMGDESSTTPVLDWSNPLRDPRDRRLPHVSQAPRASSSSASPATSPARS